MSIIELLVELGQLGIVAPTVAVVATVVPGESVSSSQIPDFVVTSHHVGLVAWHHYVPFLGDHPRHSTDSLSSPMYSRVALCCSSEVFIS